jgi:predicted TIM-barrel fold metal-dependent hydrolase
MTEGFYRGPIIDAHHHLWDLSGDKYPWLRPQGGFGPTGKFDALKGSSYLLDDYRRDIAGQRVVASVHAEALWDPEDGKINETVWLDSLDKSDNLAIRYIVGVDFGSPRTENEIREQASHPAVTAVRQTIAWTSDPDRTMMDRPHITREAGFLDALPVLIELGLSLELLMYPPQAQDVADLAAQFPGLRIVVNHIGSPIDQSESGIAQWHEGITVMSAAPNVYIKVSSAAGYLPKADPELLRPFVDHVVDSFGASRVMVGSDFPVAALIGWSLAEYFDVYRDFMRRLSPEDQRRVFFGTAAEVYGITVADQS